MHVDTCVHGCGAGSLRQAKAKKTSRRRLFGHVCAGVGQDGAGRLAPRARAGQGVGPAGAGRAAAVAPGAAAGQGAGAQEPFPSTPSTLPVPHGAKVAAAGAAAALAPNGCDHPNWFGPPARPCCSDRMRCRAFNDQTVPHSAHVDENAYMATSGLLSGPCGPRRHMTLLPHLRQFTASWWPCLLRADGKHKLGF